jgi:hypothetical protein
MPSYFEYLQDDTRIPLDEANLPREVCEEQPEHLPLSEWPVGQRERLFLRKVHERLSVGYRVIVAFSDDASEADLWWFVPPDLLARS